jgi:hypothetical protein
MTFATVVNLLIGFAIHLAPYRAVVEFPDPLGSGKRRQTFLKRDRPRSQYRGLLVPLAAEGAILEAFRL